MMWVLGQATGWLTHDGRLEEACYSGQPPYVNNPEAEDLEGKGPLPKGTWRMKAMLSETDTHGPYVIVLEPDFLTRARIMAMGRDPDSFRCHGERLEPPAGYASDGCLVASHPTRVSMWESPDHDLECV